MNKFFAKEITPVTSEKWRSDNEINRIELLSKELKKNNIYKDFEVVSAPSNGQIVLKIEKTIPANKRGLLLLNLEENLKFSIDKGITVWCEPVGDKSKLRNLRGIKFNK
tara:strand:+ start:126 stop:452 length:327 start_codon:yes stop_codon:yes gene_type:complete